MRKSKGEKAIEKVAIKEGISVAEVRLEIEKIIDEEFEKYTIKKQRKEYKKAVKEHEQRKNKP